jgi:Mor family transcriptional regulator
MDRLMRIETENRALDQAAEHDLTDEEILLRDERESVRNLIEELGVIAALHLMKAFGGTRIYVPMYIPLPPAVRNEQILAEFTGGNLKDLTQKVGLTESHIRNILKLRPDQHTIFGADPEESERHG